MKTLDIIKKKNYAGGYNLFVTEGKGNTRFGEDKKKEIVNAILDSHTQGVYITSKNIVKRQLMNGVAQFLTLDREEYTYYFR
jgi:hypothetical protein